MGVREGVDVKGMDGSGWKAGIRSGEKPQKKQLRVEVRGGAQPRRTQRCCCVVLCCAVLCCAVSPFLRYASGSPVHLLAVNPVED